MKPRLNRRTFLRVSAQSAAVTGWWRGRQSFERPRRWKLLLKWAMRPLLCRSSQIMLPNPRQIRVRNAANEKAWDEPLVASREEMIPLSIFQGGYGPFLLDSS